MLVSYIAVYHVHAQLRENSRKSVPTGVALSLAVPGTGQLYAGQTSSSWIKGTVFAACEIGFWTVFLTKSSSGRRFEKKFENYANENWSVDKYLTFLENEVGLPAGELGRESSGNVDLDKLHDAEADWATRSGAAEHHVFEQGRQQYYEMIYKYPEQFGQGWSDADPLLIEANGLTGYTPSNLTLNMLQYRGLRNKSNSAFATARTMTSLMIANRFLSAIDAAWTIRRNNKTIVATTQFHFRQVVIDGTLRTLPSLDIKF